MRADEVRAVGRLGATTFAEAVTHVERVHGAIASRAFRPASRVGAPVRVTHDAIAKTVYACVRGAGRGAGWVATEAVSLLSSSQAPAAPSTTPARSLAAAILNAAVGDKLARRGDPLAIRTAVRIGGRDVPTEAGALADAFPNATGKVVLFIHGLGETDDSWRRGAVQGGDTYGTQLQDDLGYSPVFVRYNTGRHISDNGRDLAVLLSDLMRAWPTTVDELVLVGHSMGGLVARSACHYGAATDEPWTPLVTDVFYLGSPHTGAALERLASKLGWALGHLAETRPYADLVNIRSAGIKDLRFGYVIEEDWAGCDANRCLADHRHDVDLLPNANHYVMSAALGENPQNPAARLVGDLLVQPASARGRHRRGRPIPFPADNTRHFGGLHHFDLLNHPQVYEAMRSWLQKPANAPA